MKCYIVTTSFGFIAINQDNQLIDYELFIDNQVDVLEEIDKKQVTLEELDLIKRVSKDYDEIIIETNKNSNDYPKLDNIATEKTVPAGRYVREHLTDIISNIPELKNFNIRKNLNNTYQEIAKEKIRQSIKTNDVMIIETINSLEEIEETTGKLIERLREWCMPYVPELEKIHNHELYSKLIAQETTRDNIKNSLLLENTNITLSSNYEIQMDENDLKIIKNFATSVYELYQTKNTLEEYIQEKLMDVAPNLSDVAGSNLAAKLIAHTNGLEKLAMLPSSTVQIIGAEKATFRHLKTGENPPKHGLIFQHPSIRGSNWWIRGKIARAVASKISIAARKDAFGQDFDPSIKTSLDEKIEQIRKDHPFAERKKKKESKSNKKNKKDKKRKKKKNRKKKLRKGEYTY